MDKTKDLQSQVNTDLNKLRKGDVIVLFDVNGVAIHSFKFTGTDYQTNNIVESKNGSTPLQDGMNKTVEEIYDLYKSYGAVNIGFFSPVSDKKVEDSDQVRANSQFYPNVGNSTEIK
jgi:hypothetical protein